MVVDANGIPPRALQPADRHGSPLLDETPDTLEVDGRYPRADERPRLDRGYDSERLPARS